VSIKQRLLRWLNRPVSVERRLRRLTAMAAVVAAAVWASVFLLVGVVVVRLGGWHGRPVGTVVLAAITFVGTMLAMWRTSGHLLAAQAEVLRRRREPHCDLAHTAGKGRPAQRLLYRRSPGRAR
jgi:hypothetical protein